MQKKIFSHFGPKPYQYETCEPQEHVPLSSKSSEQGPSPKVSSLNDNLYPDIGKLTRECLQHYNIKRELTQTWESVAKYKFPI